MNVGVVTLAGIHFTLAESFAEWICVMFCRLSIPKSDL